MPAAGRFSGILPSRRTMYREKPHMEHEKIIRRHILFYGRVQGVGFRYTAYYSATELGLTGWVKNKWDGSVEMEVQGNPAQIDRLLAMLKGGRFISITDMKIQAIPAHDAERRFEIH